MGQRDPAACADFRQPFLVGRIMNKMVGVSLDRQSSAPQDVREAIPEITIRKIEKGQAARS